MKGKRRGGRSQARRAIRKGVVLSADERAALRVVELTKLEKHRLPWLRTIAKAGLAHTFPKRRKPGSGAKPSLSEVESAGMRERLRRELAKDAGLLRPRAATRRVRQLLPKDKRHLSHDTLMRLVVRLVLSQAKFQAE